MKTANQTDLLAYAKQHADTMDVIGLSSNETRIFCFQGKRYVLKRPLMSGDHLSPFWRMMKNIFFFTFEKQSTKLNEVYHILRENPHISVVPFAAADHIAMIYEYVDGKPWAEDAFPKGADNALQLGQYIGYHHRLSHKHCGIVGIEDVTDFYANVLVHMKECIEAHWNSELAVDQKVRGFFEQLQSTRFDSCRYSLMMADMSADQFLYDNENIVCCVDLDAYVIGPIEWELTLLKTQIEDWERFKAGYETYQMLPDFEEASKLFRFLMALNEHHNKQEMEQILKQYSDN